MYLSAAWFRRLPRSSFRFLLVAVLLPCAHSVQAQKALRLEGDFWGVHDPSMAKEGDTWYVFATGKAPDGGQFAIRCSTDLTHWRLCGHVFDSVPDWIQKASPATTDLWAPDISHVNGEYRLYYAYSLFGKNTSGIALATNKTLNSRSADYRWVDQGLVLQSTATDDYNAIDPNYVSDEQDHGWLAFGSFWSGIKLRRLASDGKASPEDTSLYPLAARVQPSTAEPAKPGLPARWQAVEAPFLIHHGRYYYLFVSFDLCCRGAKSTYRTMVGRAKTITGPYLDRNGVPMEQGGGTELLHSNSTWAGPGGGSIFTSGSHQLLVFHAYDVTTGKPALQISTIEWKDDWPRVVLGTIHDPSPH